MPAPEERDSSPRFQRGAPADLWRNTLAQIPTLFGRLVYLSSLRNPNSGAYEHFGLAQVFGTEEADRTLRSSHEQVFGEWLAFNLVQQKADLREYLLSIEDDTSTVLSSWTRLGSYRNMVPAGARSVERELYLGDLETVLELLRREYGVALPDPEA